MRYSTENIRNVVLLGHSGSGKTTFAECMLFEAGEITRRGAVQAQNTVSDHTQLEKERGNSIFSTVLHASWKDSKINIIDTPGFDDFIGEVLSSLKVADTGIMLLNAVNGVEVCTEIVWEYMTRFNTPGIFVINRLDESKADFETTLMQAQQRFGNNVVPVQYPYNQGSEFNAIIDALRMVMYVFDADGGKPHKEPIPDSEIQKAQEMHNQLVEVAAENDEGLMERFFDEGTLNEEELAAGLTIALAHQQFFPVFCCSAEKNMGSGRIMGFINDIAPNPAQRPPATTEDGGELICSDQGNDVLFIYKTISESRIGMLSYCKVYSGNLKNGEELYNDHKRNTERINQIFISNGKNRTAVDELAAGDIGVLVKLKDTHTNDTLSSKHEPVNIAPIEFPKSRIRTAVVPPSKSDMEKLIKALHQIEEEDPTLHIEQNAQLKQTIIHGQGQLHLDLIKYRIETVNGVEMEFERPRIPYRETITKMVQTSYRHKKQSGGAGQFAEVHMRVEPYYEGMPEPDGLNVRSKELIELPWGGHLSFYWCIVGGSIDAKYQNAIKKGIMSKMEEGPLTGSYVQNVRVCIYDGKMHAVDSNDMAFMIASMMAFKESFEKAAPQILEPIYDVQIMCTEEFMGDIMGDLQTRRALIQGMDSDGHYQKILVKVPFAELYLYSSTLRSLSQGRAKFEREFSEYHAAPHDVQEKLLEEYKAHAHDE